MVRGVGAGCRYLEVFFHRLAKVAGFKWAAEAGNHLPVVIDQYGVGNGFQGLNFIKELFPGPDQGITNPLALGKDEQFGRRGIVQTDSQQDKSLGTELFGQFGQLGQLLNAGRAPGGPEVDEEEFSPEGAGIVRLAGNEILEGHGLR